MPKSKRPINKIKKDLILNKYYFSLKNNTNHTDTSFCEKHGITRTSLNNWMNFKGGKDKFKIEYEEKEKNGLITDPSIIPAMKNDIIFLIIGFTLMTVIALYLIIERSLRDGYFHLVIFIIAFFIFLFGLLLSWKKNKII